MREKAKDVIGVEIERFGREYKDVNSFWYKTRMNPRPPDDPHFAGQHTSGMSTWRMVPMTPYIDALCRTYGPPVKEPA